MKLSRCDFGWTALGRSLALGRSVMIGLSPYLLVAYMAPPKSLPAIWAAVAMSWHISWDLRAMRLTRLSLIANFLLHVLPYVALSTLAHILGCRLSVWQEFALALLIAEISLILPRKKPIAIATALGPLDIRTTSVARGASSDVLGTAIVLTRRSLLQHLGDISKARSGLRLGSLRSLIDPILRPFTLARTGGVRTFDLLAYGWLLVGAAVASLFWLACVLTLGRGSSLVLLPIVPSLYVLSMSLIVPDEHVPHSTEVILFLGALASGILALSGQPGMALVMSGWLVGLTAGASIFVVGDGRNRRIRSTSLPVLIPCVLLFVGALSRSWLDKSHDHWMVGVAIALPAVSIFIVNTLFSSAKPRSIVLELSFASTALITSFVLGRCAARMTLPDCLVTVLAINISAAGAIMGNLVKTAILVRTDWKYPFEFIATVPARRPSILIMLFGAGFVLLQNGEASKSVWYVGLTVTSCVAVGLLFMSDWHRSLALSAVGQVQRSVKPIPQMAAWLAEGMRQPIWFPCGNDQLLTRDQVLDVLQRLDVYIRSSFEDRTVVRTLRLLCSNQEGLIDVVRWVVARRFLAQAFLASRRPGAAKRLVEMLILLGAGPVPQARKVIRIRSKMRTFEIAGEQGVDAKALIAKLRSVVTSGVTHLAEMLDLLAGLIAAGRMDELAAPTQLAITFCSEADPFASQRSQDQVGRAMDTISKCLESCRRDNRPTHNWMERSRVIEVARDLEDPEDPGLGRLVAQRFLEKTIELNGHSAG